MIVSDLYFSNIQEKQHESKSIWIANRNLVKKSPSNKKWKETLKYHCDISWSCYLHLERSSFTVDFLEFSYFDIQSVRGLYRQNITFDIILSNEGCLSPFFYWVEDKRRIEDTNENHRRCCNLHCCRSCRYDLIIWCVFCSWATCHVRLIMVYEVTVD